MTSVWEPFCVFWFTVSLGIQSLWVTNNHEASAETAVDMFKSAQWHVPQIHIRTCENQSRLNWPLNLLVPVV